MEAAIYSIVRDTNKVMQILSSIVDNKSLSCTAELLHQQMPLAAKNKTMQWLLHAIPDLGLLLGSIVDMHAGTSCTGCQRAEP